jgi:predicted nuclease of restriction endonuclease-like (RecB) superfamily
MLVERLSYTHLELLAAIDDALKRALYEVECIRGNWSVRELKRQIASLYFERSGLSRDKAKLAELAHSAAEQTEPKLAIRDPYIFEFLGLRPQDVLPEADLEAALLAKLEDFLLELGHGFCFETRQKRLLIGGEAFFVDLVFYHRVLKCHVLAELKVDEFRHEHLGQLNTYVSYYRAHEMTAGDQLPVGILLCTGKNHALVEYALAGMDNRLFVPKYQLELPKPEELQRYIDEQRRLLEAGEA